MTEIVAIDRRASNTTLVTVTYADRLHYVEELLKRAFDVEGMENAIVVSNASRSDLSLIETAWGSRATVISLPANTGSANGYAVGIQAALDAGTGFIWLMDDDNAPRPGALAVLHRQLEQVSARLGSERAAVLGFRPDHQADIAAGVAASRALPLRSSFFGFHYRQIPYKIWRRLGNRSASAAAPLERAFLPYAPYGGLLASGRLFECIGLPKRDLVLYSDDTEYTYRITASGGAIELITAASLEDLEGSWNLKSRYPNSFIGWLQGGSDFRVYYTSRNQAWFDQHVWATSRFEYRLNQMIFLGLLRYFALRSKSSERLRLLRRAMRDGQSANLGIEPSFPLP